MKNQLPLVDHLNSPLDPERKFWVPAPTEIGEVRSQFSTLVSGETTPFRLKEARSLLVASLTLLAAIVLLILSKSVWGIVLVALAGVFIVTVIRSLRRHEVTYTGSQGIARYVYGKKTPSEVFLFGSANALHTNVIESEGHFVLAGYDALYQWVEGQGNVLFSLDTRLSANPQHPCQLIHFLTASERAWTESILPNLRNQIGSGAEATFPLLNGGAIRMTSREMRVERGGTVEAIAREDLSAVQHTGSEVVFIVTGSEPAMLRFNPFQIGNLRALETLIAEVYGLSIATSGLVLSL